MSQFNQTGPEKREEERKKTPIIYWAIILLLLIGCIFLFYSKNKVAQDSDQMKKELMAKLDSVKTDRASLQADFDAASAKIDQLVSSNTKLDSNLQKDKDEILAMQKKIRGMLGNSKATAAEMKKAREMINTLTDKTTQYEARIAELEKENLILTNKNITLTKDRDSAVTQNIAIKKMGSVLHASNIRMEPIHLRRNGKEVETSKAKKVDVLRIRFDIDENRIAESGNKKIYLRMVGPDGNILRSEANGSGLMLTAKGDQISYSIQKEIALIKEEPVKDVTLDWHQEGDYPKGSYLIEIFSEGFKVGSTSINLK
jgi:peptidoglycan hydrolase CwlO-like protein